jgi:hypothetical protein
MDNHTYRPRRRFFGWVRTLNGDDRGVAIITVTLVGVAVAGIVAVLSINTMRNYREAQQERQYDEVLVLAESGLDEAVFRLNADNDFTTVGTMPVGLDAAAEEAWVVGQARGLTPTTGDNGEYVIVKPDGEDVVYAVAFSGDASDLTTQVRVLKAQLEVTPPVPATPYLPNTGFASAKSLTVGGDGIGGTTGGAYARGILTKGNNKTEITGCAQAYGSNDFAGDNPPPPPVCEGTGVIQTVPAVEPLDFHSLSMYDLCPAGTSTGVVRAGPAYTGTGATLATAGQPCSGSDLGAPSAFGWSGGGTSWDYLGGAGVFYVHGGDVDVRGDSGTGDSGATIIASARNEETLSCNFATGVGSVQNGDISVRGNVQLRPHTTALDLALVAGRDITVRGTADIWGALMAREQVAIGGTPGANNAIIGSSPCDTPGSPESQNEIFGTALVTYNGGLQIPNYGVGTGNALVEIDRWSEL